MMATATFQGKRMGLDQIMMQISEPLFAMRFRRAPSFREAEGHVSPAMLELVPPRSRYVRRWRRHARRCLECANIFRALGISLK